MRYGNFELPFFGQIQQRIGFGETLRERLFAENMRARFQGCANHAVMLIGPSRCHANKVRLLPLEHQLVVGILPECPGSMSGLGPTIFIRIGHSHDFNVGVVRENQVHVVAVVSAAGMADYRRVITLLHFRGSPERTDGQRDRRNGSIFQKPSTRQGAG